MKGPVRDEPESHALMRGILAEPDDDTPRLVYADWLEENGQPERGQHIRLQCRAAALPEGDPRRAEMEAEGAALEAAHLGEWLGPLDPARCRDNQGRHFVRGLLSLWSCTVSAFLVKKHQQEAAEWYPRLGVTRMILTESSKKADGLAASPALGWTPHLRWLRSQAEDGQLVALAGSPHLGVLSRLELTHLRCTDAAFTALAKSSALPRLRALEVRDGLWGGKYTDKGVLRILNSERLPMLEELCLKDTPPAGQRTEHIARDPGIARLKRLILVGGMAEPAAIAALAGNPHAAGLEMLDLHDNDIDEAAALALAGSSHLIGLKRLDLTGMNNRGRRRLPASAEARLRERFGTALKFGHGGLVPE